MAMAAVFLKGSKILVVLKAVKFSKPIITAVSMVISAIAYGIWLGPWFGIGLVAMLFVHEMGHVMAMRFKGMEVSGPVFIPFLGAAIFAPKFEDRDTEAYVGYGGPLVGTIGALACFGAWYATGQTSEILLLLSYVGVFLNIFNLIPISPLDGGRITQAIGGWFKYVGLGLLLAYTLFIAQPAILLIWILVLDGFDRFTLWLRPALATILALAMSVLMAIGVSLQPTWVNIFDCAIAAFLTALYWSKDYHRYKTGENMNADNREYPSRSVRTKWLVYYLGLSVLAVSVLFFQIQYLPKGVHSHADKMTSPPIVVQ